MFKRQDGPTLNLSNGVRIIDYGRGPTSMTKQAQQRMERRADLASADDAKFSVRHARRRFAKDRRAGVAAARAGFRTWARKTYGAQAVRGKLLQIVGGR